MRKKNSFYRDKVPSRDRGSWSGLAPKADNPCRPDTRHYRDGSICISSPPESCANTPFQTVRMTFLALPTSTLRRIPFCEYLRYTNSIYPRRTSPMLVSQKPTNHRKIFETRDRTGYEVATVRSSITIYFPLISRLLCMRPSFSDGAKVKRNKRYTLLPNSTNFNDVESLSCLRCRKMYVIHPVERGHACGCVF